MACSNCDALRLKVERLEREMGLMRRNSDIAALMVRFGVSATQAALMLRMSGSPGALLSMEQMQAVTGSASTAGVQQVIADIRRAVGKVHIQFFKDLGYRLTPECRALILGALHPPELEDAKPVA